MFNVKWDKTIKKLCISHNIAPRGSECETTCWESWPENLFQVLNLTFDPALRLNGVITLKHPYLA